ncbi:NADPH-dependent F420 reductase, partial [Streptomyces sp. WAC05950]|uniref:NADPH-dependent F420 reductase n=1 Tax=Streptomyces sp. WAC05950 TaxID=2487419 RepID=UPI001651FE22
MNHIAVLGNGRVGSNLAAALTRAGHQVTVADRTPGAAAEAARTARIVINATPGAGSLERLAALREELRGKILVDVSNATTDGPDGLPADLLHPGSSLAEQLQEALPETSVVKTLNTMLFSVMTAPAVDEDGAGSALPVV